MLDALLNSENLLDDLGTGVVLHAPNSDILYANQTASRLLKMSLEEMKSKDAINKDWHLIDEFHQVIDIENYPVNQVIKNHTSLKNYKLGVSTSNGTEITWLLVNAYPRFDKSHELDSVAVTFVDVTQKKHDIPFESIISNANDIVVVTEADNFEGPDHPKIVYVNKAFTDLTGYSATEVLGKTPRILQGEETSLKTRKNIKASIMQNKPVYCQLLNYSKEGKKYWIELNIYPLRNSKGEVVYCAAIERDITLQKIRELELQKQANEDYLTLLPNRRAFNDKAEKVLSRNIENGISMIILDIDHFKKINDSYGHAFGDKVLTQLSKQLLQDFRSDDLLVRLGGEEFGIMLPNTSAEIAFTLMERFRRKIARIEFISNTGETVKITISIGIHFTQESEISLVDLLNKADESLYLAKGSGRNQTKMTQS